MKILKFLGCLDLLLSNKESYSVLVLRIFALYLFKRLMKPIINHQFVCNIAKHQVRTSNGVLVDADGQSLITHLHHSEYANSQVGANVLNSWGWAYPKEASQFTKSGKTNFENKGATFQNEWGWLI